MEWLGPRIALVEQEVGERVNSFVLWATLAVGGLATIRETTMKSGPKTKAGLALHLNG